MIFLPGLPESRMLAYLIAYSKNNAGNIRPVLIFFAVPGLEQKNSFLNRY